MIKLLKILIIIFLLGIGVFFGFRSLQKYIESKGILEVRIHPAEATLKINNRTYQDKQGILKIKLNPGEYSLFFSCPDYSFWEDKIVIENNKTINLNHIYLFPNNWPKENIISSKNIDQFYLSPDSNRILYIEKLSKYNWYIFDRNSKEKEYFFESSSLPNKVVFSTKKLLVYLGKNDWKIVFLPKSLIQNSISLNASLKEALDQAQLREKETSLTIDQATFYAKNDGNIIIRTPDAVYLLDFLTESIEKIHNGKSSPFVVDDDYIYFIKENGVFTKVSLRTKEEIKTSLYSFSLEDLEKTKIIKEGNNDKFLIIEGSKKAYYLKTFEDLPELISENIIDGIFSLNENEILLSSEGKIEIYNLENDINFSEKLYSDVPASWFRNNDYLLFLKDNMLNIYVLKNNKIWPIASDIKNNNFFYDSSINYIFYLSDAGIIKVSL
ncbi:MAG TPA: hypothetical protein VFD40_00560 [Candidatus Paceibacterota bacterium]|nr:hypothetical protein [Candidatus Paceibacterota bacterium]